MRVNSVKIKNYAITLLCVVFIVVGSYLALILHKASAQLSAFHQSQLPKLSQLITDTELMVRDLKAAVKVQRQEWESDEYIRYRRDGFRAGEQASIAIVKFTEQSLPRLNRTLDESANAVVSLNDLIAHTDGSLNNQFLPAATEMLIEAKGTINKYGSTAEEINRAVVAISRQSEGAISDARTLISSPEWQTLLTSFAQSSVNLAGATKNMESITGSAAEGARQLPDIASDLHQFTTTLSKYKRLILAGRILSAILPVVQLAR